MKVMFQSDRFEDVKISLDVSNIDNVTMEKREEFIQMLDSAFNTLEAIEDYIILGR